MQIVSVEEFVKLPPGTLFCCYNGNEEPWGRFRIKGKTHHDNDWSAPGGSVPYDFQEIGVFVQDKPCVLSAVVTCSTALDQQFIVWNNADLNAVRLAILQSDTVIQINAKDLKKEPLTESLVQPKSKEPKKPKTIFHVDDWLDNAISDTIDHPELRYVHFMFTHFRKPAWEKNAHEGFMKQYKLYVDYEGKTYQVTGASRLGDIWLKDLDTKGKPKTQAHYDKRIDLDFSKLSNWRDKL